MGKKILLFVLAIILAVLIYLGPSVILSLLIGGALYLFIKSRPSEERDRLVKIVSTGFILRFIVFILCMYIIYYTHLDMAVERPNKFISHTVQIIRDSSREIKNGIAIASYLKGKFGDIYNMRSISHHGFGYLHAGAWTQGIMNFIFGESVFNLFLFIVIDLWAIVLVFYIAKTLFNDDNTASLSSFMYAVMPSGIVVASTNIRFSIAVFFTLLMAFALVKFSKNNRLRHILLLVIATLVFSIYRGTKAAKPMFLILPVILFFVLNIRLRIKVIMLTLFFMMLIGAYFRISFVQHEIDNMLQNILSFQKGFVTEAAGNPLYSTYKIYDEIVYNIDVKFIPTGTIVKALPKAFLKGAIHFLFAPFPWKIFNVARLYFYPQMVLWYFIFFFGIWGIIRSLILAIKGALPLILLCIYFIVSLSLVIGNEGIAIRFRDFIAPFFYIFASSVLCNIFIFPKLRKGTNNEGFVA